MKVTPKMLKGFKAMLKDKWAPSANDNYNVATFGIDAATFHNMQRVMESKYGMRCFWPTNITAAMFKE